MTTWNLYSYSLPGSVLSGQTQIRWYQAEAFSSETDQWGLDNISIFPTGPEGYIFAEREDGTITTLRFVK